MCALDGEKREGRQDARERGGAGQRGEVWERCEWTSERKGRRSHYRNEQMSWVALPTIHFKQMESSLVRGRGSERQG